MCGFALLVWCFHLVAVHTDITVLINYQFATLDGFVVIAFHQFLKVGNFTFHFVLGLGVYLVSQIFKAHFRGIDH